MGTNITGLGPLIRTSTLLLFGFGILGLAWVSKKSSRINPYGQKNFITG
jgi:hypothetical protein